MKKISSKDWLIVAAVAALIVFLSMGAGKGKGKNVPVDERHTPLYEAIKSGRTQAETEMVCATCHGPSSLPLPKNHPPKEQCLICHVLGDYSYQETDRGAQK